MNILRCILLLQFTTALALGQPTPRNDPSAQPNRPEELVRSLYTEVVARHPQDIPDGADMKIFAPYLSKTLLHRIDLAKACSSDWDRSNSDPGLKTEMTSRFGIFSGERGTAEPTSFKIQKTLSQKGGSLRVYVKLTRSQPLPRDSWDWRVAALLIRADDHFVIDDVIYINDSEYRGTGEAKPPNRRLSEYLSAGCDGARWIGYSLPDQPVALVRGLYQHVVARKPLNIPWGEDWKIFAPYFSKALLHRFDTYRACMADWDRQNQGSTDKPPGLIEFDIFSGSAEQSDPGSFSVEKTEPQNDGSVRVYVRLRWQKGKDTETWRVADVLSRENGRFVLDEVIFLRDPKQASDVDMPLSKLLSEGCDGPHWVGYRQYEQK